MYFSKIDSKFVTAVSIFNRFMAFGLILKVGPNLLPHFIFTMLSHVCSCECLNVAMCVNCCIRSCLYIKVDTILRSH